MTPTARPTDADVREMARGLSEADKSLFVSASVYPSGVWLRGPCKHLYPLNLCRLTGELTDLGLALRRHLMENNDA